ncbi:MAG: pantoate--beta-alanine ligase, partial [Hymenobacter sp.]|nr:pantoate--beta-alanine ligase [Hymenobacter sp.]
APRLHEALALAAGLARTRQLLPPAVRQTAMAHIEAEPAFRLEYFEVADADTLQPLTEWSAGQPVALCLAAYLDDVRLIDNLIVSGEGGK